MHQQTAPLGDLMVEEDNSGGNVVSLNRSATQAAAVYTYLKIRTAVGSRPFSCVH